MRANEKYLREVTILKVWHDKARNLFIPSKIRLFGMEYVLKQPMVPQQFQPNDDTKQQHRIKGGTWRG